MPNRRKIKIPLGTFSSNPDEELQARLEIGIVHFQYIITTDSAAEPKGSIRNATGTRNLSMSFIDFNDIPMGVMTPPPHVLTYFDVKRDNWRCCNRRTVMLVDDVIEIEE